MRIATYNVEWFNNLFNNHGDLLRDSKWSGRFDVTRGDQADALGAVFAAMDADAIMVIEAPDDNRRRSGVEALRAFAKFYGLRTSEALIGFSNDTQQEISLLFDPNVLSAFHDPLGELNDPVAPRFDGQFMYDLNTDAAPEPVRWSKPPFEARLETAAGAVIRMIGVHAKSKAPYGAKNADQAMRIAIENRRKQLAQCVWLRRRVDQHLASGDDLIVLGDFNDGPGLDEYEKLFGRSGVEVVMGEGEGPCLFDPHARMALAQRVGAAPSTARFRIGKDQPYLNALLDYIMVSPSLRAKSPKWTIWHPFDNPDCYADINLREALLTASDHFPVSIDIDI